MEVPRITAETAEITTFVFLLKSNKLLIEK